MLAEHREKAGDSVSRNSPIPGRAPQLDFAVLSEGQKALIVLYMLLHSVVRKATLFCIDEPDDSFSIREIQPFLVALFDIADERGNRMRADLALGRGDRLRRRDGRRDARAARGRTYARGLARDRRSAEAVGAHVARLGFGVLSQDRRRLRGQGVAGLIDAWLRRIPAPGRRPPDAAVQSQHPRRHRLITVNPRPPPQRQIPPP